MKVKTLTKKELSEIVLFNERMFPNKKIRAEKIIDFWFNKSPEALDQCLILTDDGKNIHGQIFASEMRYYLAKEVKQSTWLFDLIVEENLRKEGWGVDLLLACMEKHPSSCSTGSGPQALPIHLKMGNKMLGEIRKYVDIVHPLKMLTSPFRGIINAEKFPSSVTTHNKTFRMLSREEMPDLAQPYNDNLFEIVRDKDFLQWRYFNDLHSYAFYKDENSDDYFVVRTTVIKHITVMLLIDYRCDMSTSKAFEDIYSAVKKLMSKLHLGMMVSGSTLKVVDSVFESHHARSVGRPRPVIGFVKVKDRKEDIEKRQFSLVTLADSDGETNWI